MQRRTAIVAAGLLIGAALANLGENAPAPRNATGPGDYSNCKHRAKVAGLIMASRQLDTPARDLLAELHDDPFGRKMVEMAYAEPLAGSAFKRRVTADFQDRIETSCLVSNGR